MRKVLCLCLTVALCLCLCACQSSDYKKAVSLMETGEYEQAIAIFEALGDYEDSVQKIKDCELGILETKYNDAIALLEAGSYGEAASLFAELGDYKDSAQLASEAEAGEKYAAAEQLLTEGKKYEAAKAFAEITDYKDAWDRCSALWGEITGRETISAEFGHTVGLLNDGTVVATGDNDYSQCNVSGMTDVVAISAGYDLTVGLRSDGTVLVAGGKYNWLDARHWTDIVAVSTSQHHLVGLRSDGTVVAKGEYSTVVVGSDGKGTTVKDDFGRCDVSDWTDIVGVSAGLMHTVGLRSDGTVVAVGDNRFGQCDVSGWTDIVAVNASFFHTVGLRSDGTVVAAGSNEAGQCDVSDWRDIVAVSAGMWHTVGLRSDGTVVAVGQNNNGVCDVSGWSDIVAVSAGGWNTAGLRSDGTVVAVGGNGSGQCDVGSWTDIKLPAPLDLNATKEASDAVEAAQQDFDSEEIDKLLQGSWIYRDAENALTEYIEIINGELLYKMVLDAAPEKASVSHGHYTVYDGYISTYFEDTDYTNITNYTWVDGELVMYMESDSGVDKGTTRYYTKVSE